MKLPHWLIVLLGAVAILCPFLLQEQSAGLLVLPHWYPALSGGVVLVLGYLGITTPSASASANVKAAAAAAVAKSMAMMLVLACVSVLTACAALLASLPNLQQNEQCIVNQIDTGDLNPVTIEAACVTGQVSTVVGFIEALLGNAEFQAKHDAATRATLDANCRAAWARLSASDAGWAYVDAGADSQ